jgi:hypothetical protein
MAAIACCLGGVASSGLVVVRPEVVPSGLTAKSLDILAGLLPVLAQSLPYAATVRSSPATKFGNTRNGKEVVAQNNNLSSLFVAESTAPQPNILQDRPHVLS